MAEEVKVEKVDAPEAPVAVPTSVIDPDEMTTELRAALTLPARPTNPFVDERGRLRTEEFEEAAAAQAREHEIRQNILSDNPKDEAVVTDDGRSVAEVREMIRTGQSPAGSGRSGEAGEGEAATTGADSSSAAPATSATPDDIISDRRLQVESVTTSLGQTVDNVPAFKEIGKEGESRLVSADTPEGERLEEGKTEGALREEVVEVQQNPEVTVRPTSSRKASVSPDRERQPTAASTPTTPTAPVLEKGLDEKPAT